MVKCNAIKGSEGNIIITEDSFDFLLDCLANQKYIQGAPPENQEIINDYYDQCRKILHQGYIFETKGYFLTKRYKYQDNITPWSGEEVSKVYELFKNTPVNSLVNDQDIDRLMQNRRLIELSVSCDYLTISKDGMDNYIIEKYLRKLKLEKL
jgi:hypothetical protein